MNIYILTEITKRELDSNLLIAILAANKGHEIFISNMTNFELLLKKKLLNPGIFHTKSLVHDDRKRIFHSNLKSSNMILTSLDEENGLVRKDLSPDIDMRFSSKDLALSDTIFCWGKHDYQSLKKAYPDHKKKFQLTGSPRVDMWTKKFSNYWYKNKSNYKNTLLFSMNFGIINGFNPVRNIFKQYEKSGYFKRHENYKNLLKIYVKESRLLIKEFITLINYLTDKFDNYQFIVRPHPKEKLFIWKNKLKKRKNLIIRNSGNFNKELISAKLVIHNGSTTAFQAAVNKIPVLSFVPFKSKISWGEISNNLGLLCDDKKKVELNIRNIFNNKNLINKKKISKILNYKLASTRNISTFKIISIWSKLGKKIKKVKNNYFAISCYIYFLEQINLIKRFIFKTLNLKKNVNYKYDTKFEELKLSEITYKIESLKKILGIKSNFRIIVLSKKFLIIKKI
tara:strand:- start:6481 stop:7842 length:1362 start_codon:yes stop_codon:yes gene_type:complete